MDTAQGEKHDGNRRTSKALWWAMGLCVAMRLIPLAVWPWERCVRDECTYLKVADGFAAGDGMTGSVGWLWAPGYPLLVSFHDLIVGWGTSIKFTQVWVALGATVLLHRVALRVLAPPGADAETQDRAKKAADLTALFYALSPSLAFYAINIWSETIYTTALLGALLLLFRARDELDVGLSHSLRAAMGAGALLGSCVLFRGIATYMLPFFAVGLLWGRLRRPAAWAQLAVVTALAIAVVAPYSLYASAKFEGTVVSDRTLGQMMYLGNNEFDPLSFDYGNGVLSPHALDRYFEHARPHCADEDAVMARDDCEREAGIDFIKTHPEEFIRRVPLRVAQMLTPHSLMTRHLRWGHWRGMPQPLKELLVAWGAVWSLAGLWLGVLGLAARGEGARAPTLAGLLTYHVAAIAVLAGLSRYRAPLEPILMIYAAALLVDLPGGLARIRGLRLAMAAVALAAIIPLSLWFLPAGWTWWRSW